MSSLRKNSNNDPCHALVPDFVSRLTTPPADVAVFGRISPGLNRKLAHRLQRDIESVTAALRRRGHGDAVRLEQIRLGALAIDVDRIW